MKIFKCPKRGKRFAEIDLIKGKCSENFCGSYLIECCPKCINKRKPVYSLLEETKEEKRIEGNA